MTPDTEKALLDQGSCACIRVEYRPMQYLDGTKVARWRCAACGREFGPLVATLEPKPEPKRGVSDALRFYRWSAAMDSWEKIEEDMENDPDCAYFDRVRALRERDGKRWEMVRRVEAELRLGVLRGDVTTTRVRHADRLCEAREGRDA